MSMDSCLNKFTQTFQLLIKIIELDSRPDRWMVEEIKINLWSHENQSLSIVRVDLQYIAIISVHESYFTYWSCAVFLKVIFLI